MTTAQNTSTTPLAEAVAYEEAIADEAAEMRAGNTYLTRALLLQLWPLLRRPIPGGFIVTTGSLPGKPYPSTGLKSLQVQIDRMDAVLTPLNWCWQTTWSEDGRLADVTVDIYGHDEPGEQMAPAESITVTGETSRLTLLPPIAPVTRILVTRRAKGGVNQGSTSGNIFKGSETNAAKLAFARVGPGHEIYVGMADFDPDTDEDSAKAQTQAEATVRKLTDEEAQRVLKAVETAGLSGDPLAHKLRAFGVKEVRELNHQQAFAMRAWIDERATKPEDA